jgi:hypothetical protein
MRMKSSTVVFLVFVVIVLLVGLGMHLMGATPSGWMDGMKKMHGRG